MGAKQTITKKVTVTRTKTRKSAKSGSSGTKKGGNQNRCSSCGRYL